MKQFAIISFLFASLVLSLTASADIGGYIGGDLGVAVPVSLTSSAARATFGFDAGLKLKDDVALGGYFITSSESNSFASVSISFFGIDVRYLSSGFNIGGRMGFALEKAGTISNTEFAPGFVAGYDLAISSGLTIGPELNWMMVFGGDGEEGYAILNIIGAIKYHFGVSNES